MSPAILPNSEAGLWDQVLAEQEAVKFFVLAGSSYTQQSCALDVSVHERGDIRDCASAAALHPMQGPSGIHLLNKERSWVRQQE